MKVISRRSKHGRSFLVGTAVVILLALLPITGQAKMVVIYGIDETGSYAFRAQAISIAAEIIRLLEPGDIFYVRRITEKSYDDRCAIFRLEIPRVMEQVSNRFNKRARLRRRRMLRRVEQVKARAIKVLAGVKPVKAPKTDIWGFLAAAADRIAYDCRQPGTEVKIVIASDMRDNCHLDPKIDFRGAEVIIAGFESGDDPVKARKIKLGWQEKLQKKQAGAVSFLPPDCKPFLHVALR